MVKVLGRVAMVWATLMALALPPRTIADEPSASEVFEQRIMPIFNSPEPSSCVECHLSSVELKDYILPDHQQTFVALRDAGLIDLESPENSRILELISMNLGSDEAYSGVTRRIDPQVRQREYEAFAEWIDACCRDASLRALEGAAGSEERASDIEERSVGPQRDSQVVRHNRLDRVVDSFERNVWSLRFRCASCHSSEGYNYAKFFEEYGEVMEWMRPEGPAATVQYLIDQELVDLEQPARSLVLLKPLNEVEHGGGLKMARHDTDYVAILGWIEDLSRTLTDAYDVADQLPDSDARNGSEIWVRIEALPDSMNGGTGLITVHRQQDSGDDGDVPVAIASVNVRQNGRFGTFAQGFLMIETPDGQFRNRLADGHYQVRLHLDRERADGESNFIAALTQADTVVRQSVRSAWEPGFRNVTAIRLAQDADTDLSSTDRPLRDQPAVDRLDSDRLSTDRSSTDRPVNRGRLREQRLAITQARCNAIRNALLLFIVDVGRVPEGLADLVRNRFPESSDHYRHWRGPYLDQATDRAFTDAWGHAVRLRVERRDDDRPDLLPLFWVESSGPDGRFDTEDDVRAGPAVN